MADIITSDIEISSGVVSSGLNVGMGAAVTVLSGGTVMDAEASEYGFFWVSEGGLVRDISLHDSGDVFLDGGRAENLTMETGGQADIMGGVLHTGTIRNGGAGVIYTGASGLEVTVSDGGRFQVYGGYAADTVVESGGSFVVQMSDGLAANTVVSSGGHARIVSGGHASRTTLNGGRVDMLSGYMYDTAISSGGTFEIMSGQAYNTDVFEGGGMAVSAAGEAHNAVVKGGALNVLSGTVYDANVLSGSALLLDAAAFRLNVSGGTVHARGGTYITNGRVSGGVLSVSSGAILNKISFNGGTLDAGAGALVSSCTFYTTGGVLNVSSGATFRKTGFTSGTMAVQAGANVSSTTIWGSGVMIVSSGALVRETAAGFEGMLVLESVGSADMVTVYGTSDYSGGVYSLNSDCGRMVVSSGAVAANVQVACGRVNVSGGLISGLSMNMGEIVIGSGGVVRDAVLRGSRSGGGFIYFTGGDLDASFGGYSGVPFLTGGGISSVDIVTAGTGGGTGGGTGDSTLDDVILKLLDDPGNVIVIHGITWSVNPAIIYRNTPTLGYLTIESGGLLEDAVASAMQITVADGGVVRNLSASDYTWITVSSGGLLTGRMSFVSGTTVTVSSGGIVDFDLSALTPNKQALLTGTGSIQGAPLYTITVSDSQSEGRYALLDGAAAFTGTLTVRSTEWAALGTLTVDTLTEIGGRYYLAKAKRNTLYLHIWNEAPTILPDPETVYLNTTWSELESGTVVSLSGGGTATVGYDAFAELEAASDAVAEQGTVIITGCEAAIPGVLSGNVAVAEDASVTGCTVGASGILTLKSGSSARDIAVLFGGTVTVEEGAVLTVTKSFTNSNGLVTVDGTFNFDISGTSGLSSTDALVTSLANIQGAPSFTLTVGAGQANGAYRLTSTDDGSTDFVLTVVDASGVALGTVALRYTLQADGSYLQTRTDAVIGGRRYSLRKNAYFSLYFQFNGLTLTITPESEKPYYTYVDASLTGKIAGDQASFVNPDTGLTDTCTFGVDAFDTLEAAFAAVDENGVVSITGGTFSPAAGITRNVILGSGMQIYLGPVSGGVLENTTVYRSLTVKNGGFARDLTVASGGSVSIVSGGTVRHLTVAAGGTLEMESGILSGGTFDAASSITVGGTLEFDISEMTPGGPALFDGLAYVGGTPNCTILVSADQAQGVYVLGVNAAGFAPYFAIGEKSSSGSSPYIIVSSDSASGASRKPNVITVGGIYCAGGVSYAIAETDGVLTLTVGSYEMPETVHVDSEWEGLASGTVVTLSGGATATCGVDAFASLATAYAVAAPDATIYIDGGTVVLADLENEKTRKTIALAGSVLRGGTGSQRYTYDLTLESGATLDSVEFKYGVLTVKSGATLAGISRSLSTVELYDGAILGGTFTASGKAVLRDVSSLDGTFVVTSNGTLTGSAEFTEDMDITVDGLIEFDLTGTTAGAPVLFRGLSFLKGTASGYAITISSSLAQQTGVYLLADGVSDFAGTVALRTDNGTKLGELEIGKGVMLGGLVYTLRGLPSDGKYVLSLVVDDENLPPLEYVYVNSSWANKKFGEVINVTGGTALYMYDAFSNLENAFAVLPYGGTVGITGGSFTIPEGTYSGTIVLDGSTLSLAPASGTFSGSVSVARKGYLTLTGGAASSVFITVESTATLTLSGPSVEAASITVDGTLVFDLFGATAGAAAIFDDFFRVRRGASSSIAVRADTSLAAGTYLLATGAAGVDQVTLRLGRGTTSTLEIGGTTYTMTSGETTYTLTVGGAALRTNGFDYSISLSESGELALNVSEYEKPSYVYVSSDWNGRKDGTKILTEPTQFGYGQTIGYNAFADLTAGLNAVAEGGTVVVRGKQTFSAANMKKCLLILDFNGEPGIEFSSCTLVTGNTVRANSASLSGTLTVSDGGTLSLGKNATFNVRRAVFLAGSTVTIDGTINFKISGMSAGGDALLSGLSFVEGATKYLLTVSGSQADGKYILVSDGASFDGVITVKSTSGTEIGTLSVGQSILDTRVTYALDLDDSDRLCLTITTRPAPTSVYFDSAWNKLGTGTAVTLEDGGTVFIGYDAFGDATGFSKVAQGGTAVIHGGTISASALRNAADIIVRGGIFDFGPGTLGSGQTITVGAGGILDGPLTIGSGGSVTVEADAMLTDGVTVTAGGILTVLSGAVLAEGVTISIGGSLNVEEGATLCVRNAVFDEGSLVVVNGTVFFDISGLSAGGDALFSGLSRFQGAPTYVLSLSAKQAPGKYILAADAGSFDGMITVTAAGAELTKISVGDSVVSDRNLYELELDESGDLCFTVTRIGGVPCVHLDSDWKSQPYGKRIFLADDSPAIIGYDAFGDSDAFLEVVDGGMAVVWNGRITSNGIGYAGNVIVREAELELTGGTVGSGRAITVTAGGTLSGTFTVEAGGAVTVAAGATLSVRQAVFESGASIWVDGVIEFDLTGMSAGGAALFHGLARVQGAPSCTLTVNGKETGVYTLATDAGNYGGVITVKNASGTEFGTLSVGGKLNVLGRIYSLATDGAGTLSLEVSDVEKPARVYANSDWSGLEDGTVVVLLNGSTAIIGYNAFGDESVFKAPSSGTVVMEKGTFDASSGSWSNIIVLGDVSLISPTASSGRTITVGAGGSLSGYITVGSGGAVTVEEGGTLSLTTGFQFETGASVMVNGTLALDISRGPLGMNSRAYGAELVRGAPTWVLTVGTAQRTGTYYLDLNAHVDAVFNVVNTDGEMLGTLSVDSPLDADGLHYVLKHELVMNVLRETKIIVSEIPGEERPSYTYVNSEWAGLADGTEVSLPSGGAVAVIGRDAFASFDPAISACRDGVSIVGGTVRIDGNVEKILGVSNGAVLILNGEMHASFSVGSGATAENVTFACDSGQLRVSSGGTLRNFTVRDGNVFVSGKITGRMSIQGGRSLVNLEKSANIDFDLSQFDGSAPLLSNVDRLYNLFNDYPPVYTITVDGDLASGEYKLAGGGNSTRVNGLSFSIVNRTGDELGTITVGSRVALNGVVYSLYVAEDYVLSLSVSAPDVTPPSITVETSTTALTNRDVSLTALVTDDGQLDGVYYRIGEEGEWKVYDFLKGVTVSQNAVVYFKAADIAGNVSEIVGCTVGNIDKTPPTMPGSLRAGVSGSMAALNWNASWDASGIGEYIVTYRNGEQEYTISTTAAGLALEDLSAGTWTWSVRAVDKAGNVSEFANAGTFTVTDEVVPEAEKRFFVGDFAGSGRPVLAKVSGGIVAIPGENGGLWGSLALEDGWSVAGVGDFDGDGKDDILRINAAGYVVGETSNGDGSFTAQVLNFKGAGWDILGVGDFDGDGKDDVLVANPTGASDTVGLLGYWKGGTEWTLVNGYSATWEMISTGDFDGDGKCDMLWKNSFDSTDGRTYNAYCTWIMAPAEGETDWRMVSVAAPDEWNYLCSGDFDGDGTADIAMINMEGVVGIWGVKNGWLDSWSIVSAVDTSAWTLAGVGDFDGDGTDDIAWRNPEAGIAGCWQIEQKQLASWQPLAILA